MILIPYSSWMIPHLVVGTWIQTIIGTYCLQTLQKLSFNIQEFIGVASIILLFWWAKSGTEFPNSHTEILKQFSKLEKKIELYQAGLFAIKPQFMKTLLRCTGSVYYIKIILKCSHKIGKLSKSHLRKPPTQGFYFNSTGVQQHSILQGSQSCIL